MKISTHITKHPTNHFGWRGVANFGNEVIYKVWEYYA